MVMRLRGRPQISVIAVYAPTAQPEAEQNDWFWKGIKPTVKEEDARGLAIVLADWNARMRARLEGEDNYIGQHTFDKRNTTLHLQSDEVLVNRSRMMYMLMEREHVAVNAFEKPEDRNALLMHHKQHHGGHHE